MSDESSPRLPLYPSQSAIVAHQLCMVLSDLVHREAGNGMSHRTYLMMCGLATAAEVFSGELAHWFGSRTGDDQEVLEGLEEKYAAARSEK